MDHVQQSEDHLNWYFQRQGRQEGPVKQPELLEMVRTGEISRDSQVWREGMEQWQIMTKTELSNSLPVGPPPIAPPPAAPSAVVQRPVASPTLYGAPPVDENIKKLNSRFTAFWICLAAGIPLSVIVIGIAGVIAASVLYCMILYQLWSLIPEQRAQTSPGKAVGFLFIPLFNLYWNFVAFHGLSKALNQEASSASSRIPPVNEGLTLTYCILACCSIIPYLGLVAAVAALVIWIITLKQMKDTGVALLEAYQG